MTADFAAADILGERRCRIQSMNDTNNINAELPAIKLTNAVLTLDQVRGFLDGRLTAAELPAPRFGPIGETCFLRTYSRSMRVADRQATMQAAA